MVNSLFLKYIMQKKGDTVEELAEHLNITRATLSAKINNKTEFKLSEIVGISRRYELTDNQIREVFTGGGLNANDN